ncbi:putative HNH family endonuclease [Dickeya phage vB_DsoM_JA33]|uniref:Putative HNH family endonuclease n=3 Tax=Salmondvirus JA11 TaxID=2734141 RepID=A0A384ZWE3_9CAUD|nr:HNH endonuclease [Dickeya phage vB_DsoM_JA11]AXG66570.1 putative HNH family endonuclease [Dickeya phage vB_DsoM_JA13]AXG67541.1 putative HNH family endonuclease [Dickeya phage vB_DsoM_JA33]AYD79972.1 putative HNH family endonuclease [Dickeya phage vB_DsoM_JA11]
MTYKPRGGIAARQNGGFGKRSTAQRIAGVSNLDRLRAGTNARPERSDWYSLKLRLIEERGAYCQNCGKATSTLILAHTIAHAKGGSINPRNLKLLCERCDNNSIGSANRRGSRLLHGRR